MPDTTGQQPKQQQELSRTPKNLRAPAAKPVTPTAPRPAAQPASASVTAPVARSAPRRSDGVLGNTKDYLQQEIFERRPYLRYAFANPYNLALLLGGVAASVLTVNPFIAIAALGLESIWLLHAPDNQLLRRLLWDKQYEEQRVALEQAARAELLKTLSEAARERVESLVARQQEINRLAAANPSFTGELLRSELHKTSRLVDSFVELALTCARYEQYLESVDVADLERARRRWAAQVEARADDAPQHDIAQKNLAVINQRIEKVEEIRNYLFIARGQLDLIENSFQLIADQIVTMQSPHELSGQLDELLDGVESIKQTAVATEKLLASL